MRRLPILEQGKAPVAEARPEPELRLAGLLRLIERPFLYADRLVGLVLPAHLNPLGQTGAIANATFIIAVISGALLLFWYSPSVSKAFSSVVAMQASPYTAQLVRSLHRYSSDGCMLFVLVHAFRLLGAQRVAGARWLAWVTGMLLFGLLWVVGWLGYWLVWDEPARQVAVGTARALDVVPLFTEPFSRSFLTDGSISSLLFFVVFFVHMLLPLGMGIALWLHIARLSRPAFLPSKQMWVAISLSLVAISLVLPAPHGEAARMGVEPRSLLLDLLYLWPVVLTDRLSGGAIWAVALGSGVFLFSFPWLLGRGRAAPATVDLPRCNACVRCSIDCPYDAIRMVPRTDGRSQHKLEAQVDPSKCVGCGVCAGSCDSAGIGVSWLPAVEARKRMDRWVDEQKKAGGDVAIAFICAHSAGRDLVVDHETGLCEQLPGYRVMPVGCIGWVHALTVERAVRHGARTVLLAGCGETEAPCREGARWAHDRMAGTREPELRGDKAPKGTVHVLQLDPTRQAELVKQAASLLSGHADKSNDRPRRPLVAIGAPLVAAVSLAAIGVLSTATLAGPPVQGPSLVISLKHPGKVAERCRTLSEQEKAAMPVHMRRDQICERGRASVRVQVEVDGTVRSDTQFAPSGVQGDGISVGIATVPLGEGTHRVTVSIDDDGDPSSWAYRDEREVTLRPRERVVLVFERATGFAWHEPHRGEGGGS